MINTTHGFNIALTEENSFLYKSKDLQDFLKSELPEKSANQRTDFLKDLETFLSMFEGQWRNKINLISTNNSYIEALIYTDKQNSAREVAVILFYKDIELAVQDEYIKVTKERLISDFKTYCEVDRGKSIDELTSACTNAICQIIKTLEDPYIFKQFSNNDIYTITLYPKPGHNSTMGLHVCLSLNNKPIHQNPTFQ